MIARAGLYNGLERSDKKERKNKKPAAPGWFF